MPCRAATTTPTAIVPAVPEVDHRPDKHALTVAREAIDVIAAASRHCDKLAAYFGETSRAYLDAVASWQTSLSQVFSMVFGAATRIVRDGDLSLQVRSGGLTYAIIFYPIQRRCTRDGCRAVINDDGRAWTYRPDDPVCSDGRHEPSYSLDAPQ